MHPSAMPGFPAPKEEGNIHGSWSMEISERGPWGDNGPPHGPPPGASAVGFRPGGPLGPPPGAMHPSTSGGHPGRGRRTTRTTSCDRTGDPKRDGALGTKSATTTGNQQQWQQHYLWPGQQYCTTTHEQWGSNSWQQRSDDDTASNGTVILPYASNSGQQHISGGHYSHMHHLQQHAPATTSQSVVNSDPAAEW